MTAQAGQSGQMEQVEVLPLFWGKIINPGEKVALDIPSDAYLVLTNACIPDVDGENAAAVLKGKVSTFLLDKVDPKDDKDPYQTAETVFAILSKGECEQVQLKHVFSPLCQAELTVEGGVPVHVSGIVSPIEDDEEGEDAEEEEEEEELNDEQLKERLKKYIKKE